MNGDIFVHQVSDLPTLGFVDVPHHYLLRFSLDFGLPLREEPLLSVGTFLVVPKVKKQGWRVREGKNRCEFLDPNIVPPPQKTLRLFLANEDPVWLAMGAFARKITAICDCDFATVLQSRTS